MYANPKVYDRRGHFTRLPTQSVLDERQRASSLWGILREGIGAVILFAMFYAWALVG